MPKPAQTPPKVADALKAAAKRALAEAEARRAGRPHPSDPPPETGGRPGPEPTRYGDWEKKGLICDF